MTRPEEDEQTCHSTKGDYVAKGLRGEETVGRRDGVMLQGTFGGVAASALEALGGVAQGAVEELGDETIEFLLAVEFDGGIGQSPGGEVPAEVIFGQDESPEDFAERDAFVEALGAEILVARLDELIGILEQPASELVENVVGLGIEVLKGELAVRRSMRAGLQGLDGAACEFGGVGLDERDKAAGEILRITHGGVTPRKYDGDKQANRCLRGG